MLGKETLFVGLLTQGPTLIWNTVESAETGFSRSNAGWANPKIKKKRGFDEEENGTKFLLCVAMFISSFLCKFLTENSDVSRDVTHCY